MGRLKIERIERIEQRNVRSRARFRLRLRISRAVSGDDVVQPFAWFKAALLLERYENSKATAQTTTAVGFVGDCDALMSKLDENLVRLANRLMKNEETTKRNRRDCCHRRGRDRKNKLGSNVHTEDSAVESRRGRLTVTVTPNERLRQHPHWEQAAINESDLKLRILGAGTS